MENANIQDVIKKKYGDIAAKGGGCRDIGGCCSGPSPEAISKAIGYTDEQIKNVPEGANLGLGCGNPVALAAIREGDVVLDLGSGAGFDAFLAAAKVGESGSVIGVDMTDEMLKKARENAEKGGYKNVEFRKGTIEQLPVEDNSVDLIISNCVINLSPNKEAVFKETFRVLKPGGKLMISDIVLTGDLPDIIRKSVEAYVGCIAGAMHRDSYLELVGNAGFTDVEILSEVIYPLEVSKSDPFVKGLMENFKIAEEMLMNATKIIKSMKFSATKP